MWSIVLTLREIPAETVNVTERLNGVCPVIQCHGCFHLRLEQNWMSVRLVESLDKMDSGGQSMQLEFPEIELSDYLSQNISQTYFRWAV